MADNQNQKLLKKLSSIDACFGIPTERGDNKVKAYCGKTKSIKLDLVGSVRQGGEPYDCPSCGRSATLLHYGAWNTVDKVFEFEEKEDGLLFRYKYDFVCITRSYDVWLSGFEASIFLDFEDQAFLVRSKRAKGAPFEERRVYIADILVKFLNNKHPWEGLFPMPYLGTKHFVAFSDSRGPAEVFQKKIVEFYNKKQEYDEFRTGVEIRPSSYSWRGIVVGAIVGLYNPVFMQFMKEYGLKFDLFPGAKTREDVMPILDEMRSLNKILDLVMEFPVPKSIRPKLKDAVSLNQILGIWWIKEVAGPSVCAEYFRKIEDYSPSLLHYGYYSKNVAEALLLLSPDNPALAVKRTFTYLKELAESKGFHGYSSVLWRLNQVAVLVRDNIDMARTTGENLRFQDINTLAKLRAVHNRLVIEYGRVKQEYDRRQFQKRVEEMLPFEYENGEYRIVAPRSPEDIKEEGRLMSHCVASYVPHVLSGRSYVFSAQTHEGERVGTIEVKPAERAIVQLYDKRNGPVSDSVEEFVKQWAKEHNLIYNVP